MEIGLQLYSIREECSKNLETVLKKVAQIGYDGVEFYDFFQIDPKRLKTVLFDIGLKSAGAHTGMDALKDMDTVLRYNTEIGTRYVVLPWIDVPDQDSLFRTCEFMNKTGETLRQNGIDFLYHNHDFEFKKEFGGKTVMQLLMENTDPACVSFETDCYWVQYSGLDPVNFLKENISRIKTIHIKDMADTPERKMTEIGTGIVDCRGLAAIGKANGFHWIIAEQDEITIDPFESIRISLNGLEKYL